MVNLPIESNRIATSDAPRTLLGGQDIASPYGLLAENMNKAAGLTDEWAKDQSTREGMAAVSEDGKTVDRPAIPIVGDAAQSFERAARVTQLNKLTPEIQNRMTEIRIDHQNDPTGFKAAADGYTKEFLKQHVQDPVLRGPVEKLALDAAGANYRSVLQQTDAQNLQNLLQTSQARLTDINDRSSAMARQGLVDTPEYAELHQSRAMLYRTLVSDRRTGFTQERADIELRSNRDRDIVQQVIGQTVNGKENEAEVRKALNDRFWGAGSENLKLTPQQRNAAITEGVAAFNNKYAEDAAETQVLRSAVNNYASEIRAKPRSFDEGAYNALVARAAGDPKSLNALATMRTFVPFWQSLNTMTAPQRAAAVDQMSRNIVPQNAAADAMTFFQEKGYSKEAAAGIVGNLIQESGLDPNAVHDNGTGLGIAGHRLERREALKAFAAERGKPATDFRTQLEFIDHELKTSEGSTGAALRNAKTAEQAATAFINFERPLGWTAATPQAGHGYGNRVANASALAGGDMASLKPGISILNANPYVQRLFQDTLTSLRQQQAATATKLADDLVDRANKHQRPEPGQIDDLVLTATSANRPDLIEKVKPTLLAYERWQAFQQGTVVATEYGVWNEPPPSSAVAAAQVRASAAGGATMLERQVLNHLADYLEQGDKAMAENPVAEAANRGWVKPPNILVTSDPRMAAAEFADRERKIGIIRQRSPDVGAVKVIGDEEAAGIANALTRGDVSAASGFIQAMSAGLSNENFAATLASKPIAGAITGMINNIDPNRMNAGMMAADKLWRIDPTAAESALGAAATTKLHAWQALKDTMAGPEVAALLNKPEDPALLKARKELKEIAQQETSTMSAEDLAYKLGSSWGIPIVSSIANPITGATPAIPFNPAAAREMVAEYREAYGALRSMGVDPDKAPELALQRLRSSWGVSEAAGNRLMKNPPENSPAYPSIGGSKDWVAGDLKNWVAAKVGLPEMANSRRSSEVMGFSGQNRNWQILGLISDGTTQAQMTSGGRPSYQVAIRNADGMMQLVPGRITFDPVPHIERHTAQLQTEFKRRTIDRWATSGDRPSYLFGEGMPVD